MMGLQTVIMKEQNPFFIYRFFWVVAASLLLLSSFIYWLTQRSPASAPEGGIVTENAHLPVLNSPAASSLGKTVPPPTQVQPNKEADGATSSHTTTAGTNTDSILNSAPSATQSAKVITTLRDILNSQEKMVDALMANQHGIDKEWRFFDLMAPLGVLDPYASENSSRKDGAALMNQLFGYYGSKYEISESRIFELVELPLSYATQNFDVDDYFKQNQSKLNDIQSLVDARPDLKILAYWTSGVGRVNETFNAEIGFWKQDGVSGGFIDLSNVSVATTNQETQKVYNTSSIAKLDPQETVGIVDKMASINVTIVYKCAGKTIYIMGSTADNASGFLRNGTVASDVNCGLLANRFEIVKEKQLDNDWIFW